MTNPQKTRRAKTALFASSREQWMNDFVAAARPVFEAAGSPIPVNLRCSVGFPSKGLKSKSIGECWTSSASADDATEIFVHPVHGTGTEIADTLTHELAHAAAGIAAGHGPKFRKVAKAVGLVGPMKSCGGGPLWHEWADPIIERLGPIPHAKFQGGLSTRPKKQGTRLLKCECDTCGFTFRTTAKWIAEALAPDPELDDEDDQDEAATLDCPNPSCSGRVNVEFPAEEGEGEGE